VSGLGGRVVVVAMSQQQHPYSAIRQTQPNEDTPLRRLRSRTAAPQMSNGFPDSLFLRAPGWIPNPLLAQGYLQRQPQANGGRLPAELSEGKQPSRPPPVGARPG
jgi:hypothetical protein